MSQLCVYVCVYAHTLAEHYKKNKVKKVENKTCLKAGQNIYT